MKVRAYQAPKPKMTQGDESGKEIVFRPTTHVHIWSQDEKARGPPTGFMYTCLTRLRTWSLAKLSREMGCLAWRLWGDLPGSGLSIPWQPCWEGTAEQLCWVPGPPGQQHLNPTCWVCGKEDGEAVNQLDLAWGGLLSLGRLASPHHPFDQQVSLSPDLPTLRGM